MRRVLLEILVFIIGVLALVSCKTSVTQYEEIDRLPVLFPDYTEITLPPNIAPLNFMINEEGNKFEARFYVDKNNPVIVRSNTPEIRINIKKWRRLLEKGSGSNLYFDVFVKSEREGWQKFQTIKNKISKEKIDSHLAYRLINTGYVLWNNLGIYQRNLETFEEKAILENKAFEYGCINCHSFANNNPEKMMIHVRAIHGGTIIGNEGKLDKVDTKTEYTLNAGAYPAWHPDGKHIAYSVNSIGQYFCSGEVRIEVADQFSDLIVYDVEKNVVTTSPKVSTSNRENLPVWSPDGKFIYYISAIPANSRDDRIDAKYSLLRIAFDVENNTWGEVDTIISGNNTGKSISFPKISPNGKYLMYCTSENGYFTIHHPKADLNLLNLQTGEMKDLGINSPETDSYHSFSSGGKWFVFSSKRMDGLFTRPFFSYLDENGNASKPFVLPQKDPAFYHTFIRNFNIPELISGEVPFSPLEIRDKVLEDAVPAKFDFSVDTVYMKKHLKHDTEYSPHS